MRSVLAAENVSVRFRKGQAFSLRDFSASLNVGEVLVIVGESGAGKSTFLNAVAGFAPLSSGTIEVAGNPVLQLFAVRRNLGLVLQSPRASLDPTQRVLEAVAEPLVHLRGMGRRRAREEAAGMLELFGIARGQQQRRPHGLSGGECQRVSVARALIHSPPLVLADEPTASLDPLVGASLVQDMKRVVGDRKLAMVYVTHNLREPVEFNASLAVLLRGLCVEMIPAFTAWEEARHPYSRYLARAMQEPVPSFQPNPAGCPFFHGCDRPEEQCRTQLPQPAEASPGHVVRCCR